MLRFLQPAAIYSVATKRVTSCGYSNVAIVTSTSSVWSSYGTGSGTPIRLAFDSNGAKLLVSRSNGNVVFMNPGAGGGTSINTKFGLSNSVDVLGLAYNPSDSLVYAFQRTRTPTTGGSHAVVGSPSPATPWSDIAYSTNTRSLFLADGVSVLPSVCYGSSFNAGNIFEGGCIFDSVETNIDKNGIALSGFAPAAIRSLLITNDSQYMFVGCADGNVYLVSGWK